MTLTVVSAQADPPLFQTPKEYPGTPGLGHGAVISADFNGDGFPDLAMVDVAAGAVRVLLNQRNGSRIDHGYRSQPGADSAVSISQYPARSRDADHLERN